MMRLVANLLMLVYLTFVGVVLAVALFIEFASYNWLFAVPIPILGPLFALRRWVDANALAAFALLGTAVLVAGRLYLDLWLLR